MTALVPEAVVHAGLRAEPVADRRLRGVPVGRQVRRRRCSNPRKWKPQTPTKAYMELRDDDAFWAARRVAAFTDDMIAPSSTPASSAIPQAEKYLADVLIQRRDTIKRVYLTAVNPIVDRAPGRAGPDVRERGRCRQASPKGPVSYPASWMEFDNTTSATKPLSETKSETTTIAAPTGSRERFRRGRHRRGEREISDLEAARARLLPSRWRQAGSSSASSGSRSSFRPPAPLKKPPNKVR